MDNISINQNSHKICATNLNISFPLLNVQTRSFRKKLIGKTHEIRVVNALKNISLKINCGDKIGVYGHNGAGKSTFLRAIVGAYPPSSGSLEVVGKVSSMINLHMGLDYEATGYENIVLKLGLEDKSLRKDGALIERIIQFSELNEFIHMPIRTYSTGMVMRLAFSIVSSINSDIIVLDEWLSVGDEKFSSKATKRLNNLIENNSIMIIASHNIDLLHNTCNRLIVLNSGEIIDDKKI